MLIYSNNYAIILLFKKEAGENPARARRREVQKSSCLARGRKRGHAIGFSEKVAGMYRVEISV